MATESKDQAFNIVYVSEERPDKSNLALIRAVNKVSTLWATDAEEALKLFRSKPPRNVYHVLAAQPAGIDRTNWIEIADDERQRVTGVLIVK